MAPGEDGRTGRRLWLPLLAFTVLVVVAVAIGRYVVPAGGPSAGAQPHLPAGSAPTWTPPPSAPTLPPLPTPPVRPADQLESFAGKVSAAVGIPVVAVQAYGYAQLVVQRTSPDCHLGWTTLAAIGEIESQHGQAANAVLQRSGRSTPVVTGPVLDGAQGRALVRDTDAGAFDGDITYDRSMGPLHLMPSVWRVHAADADADGIVDPFDVDDSALALGRLLCSAKTDMRTLAGWNTAIGQYHTGQAYAKSVFAAADSYGQRTKNIA